MISNQEKHLSVLGLKPGATVAEIRSAYKRLAILWHPDKNKSKEATSTFQEISHAYTALTDPSYQSDHENDDEFSQTRDGLEKFMNIFQQAFFGSAKDTTFVFSDGASLYFDSCDEDGHGFEPEELFPLQLVESAANSLFVNWVEGLIPVPSGTIFRLDICCPDESLPWSVCYLGTGQQCRIAELLPGTLYDLRLGVVDGCNKIIDISSQASFQTAGNEDNRKRSNHPKISRTLSIPKSDAMSELSYEWNMNPVALYEKLVIDPDVDIPISTRFNFGDDDDASFEIAEGSESDDLYDEYVMYSDGEMLDDGMYDSDDIDGTIIFSQINLQSGFPYIHRNLYPGTLNNDSALPSRNHQPKSNKLCQFFKKGACRYGTSCRYSHDPFHQKAFDFDNYESAEECSYADIDAQANSDVQDRRSKPMPPCRFFQAGCCKKNHCKFSHDSKQNSVGNQMSTGASTSASRHRKRFSK